MGQPSPVSPTQVLSPWIPSFLLPWPGTRGFCFNLPAESKLPVAQDHNCHLWAGQLRASQWPAEIYWVGLWSCCSPVAGQSCRRALGGREGAWELGGSPMVQGRSALPPEGKMYTWGADTPHTHTHIAGRRQQHGRAKLPWEGRKGGTDCHEMESLRTDFPTTTGKGPSPGSSTNHELTS